MTSILSSIGRSYRNQFKRYCLRNKSFYKFVAAFLKSTLIFEHFEEKITFIAHVFPKLRTAKGVIKEIFKTSRFRKLFESPWTLHEITFITSFDHATERLSCKISLVVVCDILRLFLHTLTADGKYSLRYRENLPSEFKCSYLKNKIFSEFVAAFLKTTLNFEDFEERMLIFITHVFPKLQNAKNIVR